jgi:hypothetical protein
MTNTILRNSFFALLGMILVAVAVALLLNTPSEAGHPIQAPAAAYGAEDASDYVPADSHEPKVIDARIQSDSDAG